MNTKIESILLAGIFESQDKDALLALESFQSACNLITKGKDIFHKVPEEVHVYMEQFQELEEKAGTKVGLMKDHVADKDKEAEKAVKYFRSKGVMLYDGIHASAFGRMSYIYRTKGIRLYLYKNGKIIVLSPYCTIDHNGFHLRQEEFDFYIIKNTGDKTNLKHLLSYMKEDDTANWPASYFLIDMLCNIKKDFHRDYYIEYLLTPPDVDILSSFSETIREQLWDLCLSNEFAEKWGRDVQDAGMNILSFLKITPSPGQLLGFLKRQPAVGNQDLMERINQLEANLTSTVQKAVHEINEKDEDLFEVKPDFAGIGINLNAAFKRVKKKLMERQIYFP